MCISGKENPEGWPGWLREHSGEEGKRDDELLGLLPYEFADLSAGMRTMRFYVFKRKTPKSVFNVFPGAYVKFAFETDSSDPHFEQGWVDIVSPDKCLCRIQVDDGGEYNGLRAVSLRITDVVEILPSKERPLVYYKSMICGKCNDCDRLANAEVPASCPHRDKFSIILKKQRGDGELIDIYKNNRSKELLDALRRITEIGESMAKAENGKENSNG